MDISNCEERLQDAVDAWITNPKGSKIAFAKSKGINYQRFLARLDGRENRFGRRPTNKRLI